MIKTKETKKFKNLILSSNFNCGSGIDFKKLKKNYFGFIIPEDPPNPVGGDYRWYFCIKIINNTKKKKKFIVDALRKKSKKNIEFPQKKVPVFISSNFIKWRPVKKVKISNDYDYRLELEIKSHDSFYISNSIPKRYKSMCEWLKKTNREYKNLTKLKVIGKSCEGNKIYLLSIQNFTLKKSESDRILITSGLHPAEPDWLATTSIIQELLKNNKWAKKMRNKYTFDIVTQLNPDGFILGTNGCNAKGINPYWDFRKNDYNKSPETSYLWKWIALNPPSIYIDFHCYVHNVDKDYKPYIKPIDVYNHPKIKKIVENINKKLIKLCNGRYISGKSTNLPSTLAYKITKKYNTITYTKFHLHLKHGIVKSRKLALLVIQKIIEVIEPYKSISELQKETINKNQNFILKQIRKKTSYILKKFKNFIEKKKEEQKVKDYYGSLWYEDVCNYFDISKEEATKRATSPKRKSKKIWEDKRKIERSEKKVIEAWKSDDNMVIRNCWYRERKISIRWKELLSRIKYKKGERILDYGCGVSSFTKWALLQGKYNITLADIDGPLFKFCKWRYGDKVSYCTIDHKKNKFPLKKKYDIIFCIDVLEHVWSPLKLVKHFFLHLKSKGRLVETFIDDSSGSNLTKANIERPYVFKFLRQHFNLVEGILDNHTRRIWIRKKSLK